MEQHFFKADDVCALRGCRYVGNTNIFSLVTQDDIIDAESLLGFSFPPQLEKFYLEIGHGNITEPHDNLVDCSSGANEILPPLVCARFSKGILKWEGQSMHWMSEEAYEDLEPGDLPFFEIMNSSKFLIMKINSENPNAVWYDNIKISDSLEEFVWRLYYENPTFYDDIIEAYYKNK